MAAEVYRREQKRKRIMSYFINAAIELIERDGIENLTIRKVAERVGYNSATLYHYFDGLDELELFASVKCLNQYMKETPIGHTEGVNISEWYLAEWDCFCRHSFRHPRIYNFLFFSRRGEENLTDVFAKYYEIYPQEKYVEVEEYGEYLMSGDFSQRNFYLIRHVIEEKHGHLSKEEIYDLNRMSVLVYRGMLETMRSGYKKPSVEEATDEVVRYLGQILKWYGL